jgi:hypothetical protein
MILDTVRNCSLSLPPRLRAVNLKPALTAGPVKPDETRKEPVVSTAAAQNAGPCRRLCYCAAGQSPHAAAAEGSRDGRRVVRLSECGGEAGAVAAAQG